ncbi:16S rRNA (cytosine(967)-C(5))-methyltransferase [Anthocerotibacter panamensis]|uniref:16S rRNA (cytosine(967)-C(5))-methyltransferase n=1 Tax=Anthocerotibacter panamensis TaxID=2857077 RepID=UPI001C404994|nr:16S rRNA (cytosine(967)-C(5))-methyltransferase [Anthocerotibacter panamensis]
MDEPNRSSTEPTTAAAPRTLAFLALRAVQRGAFADVALDRALHPGGLSAPDRRLVTELVYGCVKRERTLDALIDQLARKKTHQQPPDLRAILHLGFYQLRYLDHIPQAAAVDTTVELARQQKFGGLTGVVNGLLRQYLRLAAGGADPLVLPQDPIARLGVLYSFPDWILEVWLELLGLSQTEALCCWLNRTPHLDIRVNPLRATTEQVQAALETAGLSASARVGLPQALRVEGREGLHPKRLSAVGPIPSLPGFTQGWWMVQDSSAQWVGHLLDPKPGEVVVDACAAPGGKALHLAELMGDEGTVWACDRSPARLKRLAHNAQRLGMHSLEVCVGDSRDLPQFKGQADRVLLDAPCSGLGTLHRHADARWRQTPDSVQELAELQRTLLEEAASWVKATGTLVYATCTLHPAENERVIEDFLGRHPEWRVAVPELGAAVAATPEGWVKIWPQQQDMDGFFMVRLQRNG